MGGLFRDGDQGSNGGSYQLELAANYRLHSFVLFPDPLALARAFDVLLKNSPGIRRRDAGHCSFALICRPGNRQISDRGFKLRGRLFRKPTGFPGVTLRRRPITFLDL